MYYKMPEKVFENLRLILHTRNGGNVELVTAWMKKARLYPDHPEPPLAQFTVILPVPISSDE